MGPRLANADPHSQLILVRRLFEWANLEPLVGELDGHGRHWAIEPTTARLLAQKEEHRHIPNKRQQQQPAGALLHWPAFFGCWP